MPVFFKTFHVSGKIGNFASILPLFRQNNRNNNQFPCWFLKKTSVFLAKLEILPVFCLFSDKKNFILFPPGHCSLNFKNFHLKTPWPVDKKIFQKNISKIFFSIPFSLQAINNISHLRFSVPPALSDSSESD